MNANMATERASPENEAVIPRISPLHFTREIQAVELGMDSI